MPDQDQLLFAQDVADALDISDLRPQAQGLLQGLDILIGVL